MFIFLFWPLIPFLHLKTSWRIKETLFPFHFLSMFSISNRMVCPIFDVILEHVNRSRAMGARLHLSRSRCCARLLEADYCAHNGSRSHQQQYLKMVTAIYCGFTHCALEDRDGRTMDTRANPRSFLSMCVACEERSWQGLARCVVRPALKV